MSFGPFCEFHQIARLVPGESSFNVFLRGRRHAATAYDGESSRAVAAPMPGMTSNTSLRSKRPPSISGANTPSSFALCACYHQFPPYDRMERKPHAPSDIHRQYTTFDRYAAARSSKVPDDHPCSAYVQLSVYVFFQSMTTLRHWFQSAGILHKIPGCHRSSTTGRTVAAEGSFSVHSSNAE